MHFLRNNVFFCWVLLLIAPMETLFAAEPIPTNNVMNIDEDNNILFSIGDFTFNDADDDILESIIILSLPDATRGTLYFDGAPVVLPGKEIDASNIINLSYIPANNGYGIPYDSLEFQVVAGGELSTSSAFIIFNVSEVNDPPFSANMVVELKENTSYKFSDKDFEYYDVEGDPFKNIRISKLPSKGELLIKESKVQSGDIIEKSELKHLKFVPAQDEFGVGYTSFYFNIGDGKDLSDIDYEVVISVLPVNTPPTSLDFKIWTDEDISYAFKVGDFPYKDLESSQYESIIIKKLPASGKLELAGTPIKEGAEIRANEVNSLEFVPISNEYGDPYANFTFYVFDGIDKSKSDYTCTIIVQSVNDLPQCNPIGPININEDDGKQIVKVDGINAGPNESQTIYFSAQSDVAGPVDKVFVNYKSPDSKAELTFQPVSNGYGKDTIIVYISDGIDSLVQKVPVMVYAVNDQPVFDQIASLSIDEDAGLQKIKLTGVSAGPKESQTLVFSVSVDNPKLLNQPTITYNQGDSVAILSFTPKENQWGSCSVSVKIDDQQPSNNTFSRTFVVNVNGVNDPPTIAPIPSPLVIKEDAGVQIIALTGISAGPNENGPLNISATTDNNVLVQALEIINIKDSTAQLKFVPLANSSGEAKITIRLNDGNKENNITTASFTVNVVEENDPPTVEDLSSKVYQLKEDFGVFEIVVKGITAGPNESQDLLIEISTDQPTMFNGITKQTYTNTDSIKVHIKSATNQFGSANVSIKVDDQQDKNNTVSTSFKIVVMPVADTPAITDAITNVDKQTVDGLVVTRNSADGSEVPYIKVSNIKNGTLFKNDGASLINNDNFISISEASKGLKFTPRDNSREDGSFTIQASTSNSNAGLGGGIVAANIMVNDIPYIKKTLDRLSFNEDDKGTIIKLSEYFDDFEDGANSLSYTILSVVNNGLFSVLMIEENKLIVTPKGNLNGNASFVIRCLDSNGAYVDQLVNVEIAPVNDAPTFSLSDTIVFLNKDSVGVQIQILDISSGPYEDQLLNFSVRSDNDDIISNLNVDYTSPNTKGLLMFNVKSGAVAKSTITMTLTDDGLNGGANSNSKTEIIQVFVNPDNEVPIFVTSPNTTAFVNKLYEYEIMASDPDNDRLSFVVDTLPKWMSLSVKGQNTALLNGTPTILDTVKSFPIHLMVRDSSYASSTQSFNLRVREENLPPVFVSAPGLFAVEKKAYTYIIEFSDPNAGDVLKLEAVSIPNWLQFTNGEQHILSGIPPLNSVGKSYSISLKLSDQDGLVALQNFTIIVRSSNSSPLVDNISIEVDEDVPFLFSYEIFASAFSDPDSDSLRIVKFLSLPDHGELRVKGSPIVKNSEIQFDVLSDLAYYPDSNYSGFDDFDWAASDGTSYSTNTAKVNIIVIGINDPPVIQNVESYPIEYASGYDSISFTRELSLYDAEQDKLDSAVVWFSTGYNPDEDTLYFTPIGKLSAYFNDSIGALIIEGYDRLSVYESALHSVVYKNRNPLAVPKGEKALSVVVSDGENLSNIESRNIVFFDSFIQIDIPNAFTLNNDGINETWKIPNIENYPECIVNVYSPDGFQVFHSIGYSESNEWDGTYKGATLSAGTYYYTIEIRRYRRKYSGALTILK